MGLDMYAYMVEAEDVVSDLEYKYDESNKERSKQFYYWRKHHDLHGWMEQLYRSRGGTEVFNCKPVRLHHRDLDQLESDLELRMLPETTGFFFGNNPPDEDSNEYDREFIAKAREAIAEGKAVYYDSWW